MIDHLLKLNQKLPVKLRILRLYGRMHEKETFPDPFDIVKMLSEREPKERVKEQFKSDSLHHIIREKNPNIEQLAESCIQQLRNGYLPSRQEREEYVIHYTVSFMSFTVAYFRYRKSVSDAEQRELKSGYEVILCTCNETCSFRFKYLIGTDYAEQDLESRVWVSPKASWFSS